MDQIALGVKLFSRTDRLRQLLDSVPSKKISTAHIAHDGKWNDNKRELFSTEYDFNLNIIDLEYDVGVSAGKNAIVSECTSDYLLMVDSDHKIPTNIDLLYNQMLNRPDMGGISGNIIEPHRGRLWQSGKDLLEKQNVLIRDASGQRQIDIVAGSPLIEFDFVPAAILLRMKCLEEYKWDEKYIVGSEHLDFHVGHWKKTDWKFGINSSVTFEHYPGGNKSYMSTRHGKNVDEGRQYLLKKWGYDLIRDKQPYWFDTGNRPLSTRLRRSISRNLPLKLYSVGKRVYDSGLMTNRI